MGDEQNRAGLDGERYFRLIAENLTDMVAVLDTQGRRLYCTPNYAFLGEPDKLAGSISFNDIHPEDRDRIMAVFRGTVQTGQGRSAQYRMLLADGSVRHIQSHGIAVKNQEGAVEKVITVSRDVTESLAAAEKQRALELQLVQADKLNALGKTVSGVAHELNNPLTGIMGFCQLLLRDEGIQENSRWREDITTVFQEAERCQKIVRNLTTFARRHAPEKNFIGLNGLIEDSLKLQEKQLQLRGIEVETSLAPDLPKTMADFHQLQQVFINLIVNAQDAMEGRTERKALRIATSLEDDVIRIGFSDSGPGIPSHVLPCIFEPFYTTKESGKGTGLGLAISFGIIAGHRGRIWAESPPGKGAMFIIELPVEQPPATARPAQRPALAAGGKRVLIIDDEACVVDVTLRILRLIGISPDTARDPATARKKIAAGDYDAVLCDFRLPGESGLDLFNWVAGVKPALAARWIFLTGSSGGETLAGTGRPVLSKPYTIEELQELLGTVLSGGG